MKRLISTGFVFALMVMSPYLSANVLKMDSGEQQVQLLELYTSQGCSSCPPAEIWLNNFTENDDLWNKVVPLAFHVDYWDYLGWKDRYALNEYSTRQRTQRQTGAVSSVYTPGFVVDGKEWKGWFSRRDLPNDRNTSGRLVAEVEGDRISATYSQTAETLVLNIALLGFDIESEIAAGENHGETLPHEFVVLNHTRHVGENGRWQVTLPENRYHEVKRFAVAVWVTSQDSLKPLQATGGWLVSANQ